MVDKNGRTGIFCPACDKRLGPQANLNELIKAQHFHTGGGLSDGGQMIVRCPDCGARYDYERLIALSPRMKQIQIIEKQPANTIPLTIWVYPEPLEALRQRFPQNFMTTMTAWFTAVADPDTVMIEGEHGRALKQSGVLRGRDVEGLGPYIKQLEQDVADAKVRERALGPLLAMMQMLGQGAGAGAGQAGTGQVGTTGPGPVPFIMPATFATQQAAPSSPQPAPSPDYFAADYVEEPDPFAAAAAAFVAFDPFAGTTLPAQPAFPNASPAAAATGEAATPVFHGLPKPIPGGR